MTDLLTRLTDQAANGENVKSKVIFGDRTCRRAYVEASFSWDALFWFFGPCLSYTPAGWGQPRSFSVSFSLGPFSVDLLFTTGQSDY